jgi:hypothetical protein
MTIFGVQSTTATWISLPPWHQGYIINHLITYATILVATRLHHVII